MAFLNPTKGKVVLLLVDYVRSRHEFILFAFTEDEGDEVVKTLHKERIEDDPDDAIVETDIEFSDD